MPNWSSDKPFIWTNDCLGWWRIYASLGLNELRCNMAFINFRTIIPQCYLLSYFVEIMHVGKLLLAAISHSGYCSLLRSSIHQPEPFMSCAVHQCLNHWNIFEKLSHWGLNKMAGILQMTMPNVLSWVKFTVFLLNFPWGLFSRVQLTICQHWFR